MIDVFTEFWRINPIAMVFAYIPLLAGIAMWIAFYVKYDWGVLRNLKLTFKQLRDCAEGFSESKTENLNALDDAALEFATIEFEGAWRKMMNQAERRYTGGIIPEAGTFFHEDALITVPAHRRTVKMIYSLSIVLTLLSVVFPRVIDRLMHGSVSDASLNAGMAPAGLILVGILVFAGVDILVHNSTLIAFQRFLFTFDMVIPTADALAGPALLVEASSKSQKAFETVSEKMLIAFSQNTEQAMAVFSQKSEQMIADLSKKSEQAITDLSHKSENLVAGFSEKTEQLTIGLSDKTEQMIASFSLNTQQMATVFSQNTDQMSAAVSQNTMQMVSAFSRDTREMATAFSKDTEKLVQAVNELGSEGVVPAVQNGIREMTDGYIVPSLEGIRDLLAGTLAQVVEKQETGVKELTDSFAARLADTLEIRMNGIAGALAQYQNRMEEQNTLYQERIESLNGLLSKNMQTFFDFMQNLKEILGGSAEVLNHADEFYRFELENREKINEHEKNMLKITDNFRVQAERFAQETLTIAQENHKAQQSFGVLVAAITERMEEAMAGAGKYIASGITGAVADNAKAIEDLTVQAQALRSDYEAFFTRREDSVQRMMDEMDYQIQGLITRLSEDVGVMLKTSVDENSSILSQYKDQTATLLLSFDEQARSMGLYAKEINMDVADLSQNLKVSVSEFNEKIKEGVQMTISDFDKGFAELAGRIANTVESIADAVENLPASIKAGRYS
ncbi:MAG TPA: hypothetical protein VN381_08950 [Anaerovoracaceae bacterium]|nr:hypothetical protein [Anaerovoracaceae bacterium]